MKELLRKKLLEARNEFEELDEKEKQKYKKILVEVALTFDSEKNIVIIMRNVAISQDDINFPFGCDETIETETNDINVFMELLKYAEDRYGEQFTYAIHPAIYCYYGKSMYTKKFEHILQEYVGDEEIINDKMGFAISETIF